MVDDDSRIVKTTCDILKIKGFEVIAASSGEEGIERVKHDAPDCVLMDIKMAGINGVEAMKRMREIAPAIPVVLVSAYATDEVMAEAKRVGAYAVLSKPLNFPAILSFFGVLEQEESILVVDDSAAFSTTLREVLASRGYVIETDRQPRDVLGRPEKRKLAVMLDLNVADVGGLEVLAAIRAEYPSVPVVLVSSDPQQSLDTAEIARRLGAYSCVYKPLEMDHLLKLFEEIRLAKAKRLLAPT
ncbi:MAG: hypothetical protein NVS4B5_19260 [Vulcanimicrobiaceae bacterium]